MRLLFEGARQTFISMRPLTLWASIFPVLIGTAYARQNAVKLNLSTPGWIPALALCLLVAIFLQLAANYANDYYDSLSGVDDTSNGKGKRLSTAVAKRRYLFTVTMAAVCGVILLVSANVTLIAKIALGIFGIISLLLVWGYSGSKHPYGHYGPISDIVVFVTFGIFATIGTFYVLNQGAWPVTALETAVLVARACSIGFVVIAMLVIDNIRDIETDKAAGKMSSAVKLGERGTRIFYHILTGLSILVAIAFMRLYFVTIAAGLFVFVVNAAQYPNLSERDYGKAFKMNCLLAIGLLILLIF